MENYVELYGKLPLFAGVSKEQLIPLLKCLKAEKHIFAKGEWIFNEGERITTLGIILKGRINTVYEDILGGNSIIGTIESGQMFCDAFSCSTAQRMPLNVQAQIESEVLLIDIGLILPTCASACEQHRQLSENLIHILADKYVTQNCKLINLSARTTRRKLLSYLSEQMRMQGGETFTVPFNRQELADYLFVDRTGLSTQWNLLIKQGILTDTKRGFTLNAKPNFNV